MTGEARSLEGKGLIPGHSQHTVAGGQWLVADRQ